jgi:hypothetical protein
MKVDEGLQRMRSLEQLNLFLSQYVGIVSLFTGAMIELQDLLTNGKVNF